MFTNFYKVIYNFYVSKNEKDIPHIYTVSLISVLQGLNILTIIMLINMYKMSILMDKSFAIKLSIVITVFNFIAYHKYAKRNPELFEIGNESKINFLIYFLATLVIWVGVIIIKQIK